MDETGGNLSIPIEVRELREAKIGELKFPVDTKDIFRFNIGVPTRMQCQDGSSEVSQPDLPPVDFSRAIFGLDFQVMNTRDRVGYLEKGLPKQYDL